jgi:hypothetical protein
VGYFRVLLFSIFSALTANSAYAGIASAQGVEQHFIDGMYFGLVIALVLYNLFLFFASRQYTYLFFSLFLAASGVLIYVGSGVSTILGLLVPSSLPLAYLCLGMVLVFGALFSISLLNIKSTNKTLSNTWFTVLLLNVAATSIIVYIAERENFPLPR